MLSSESVEEYLEAIYTINEEGQTAKNQILAETLRVSPPSVTQMIQKLADDGLVKYEPYKGATLTGKGMALAQRVVRKHRLIERFLHDVLGLQQEMIHEQACMMEHSLMDETAAALCRVMNKPEISPDDQKAIPECPFEIDDCEDCEQIFMNEYSKNKLRTQLSNMRPGEEGVVELVKGGKLSCQRILDMGLTPGTEFKVLSAAPFHGPIEVKVRGTSLALGRALANKVFVLVHDDGQIWKKKHPHGPHHGRQSNRTPSPRRRHHGKVREN